MTTTATPVGAPLRVRRPWYRWLLTALAFPPAGYLAHLVAGPVDSLTAAVLGGVLAGAGIGAAQWALLLRRDIDVRWVAATAGGLGVRVAAGAALVSYRTDLTSLALMGAVSGLCVGAAQGLLLDRLPARVGWSLVTAATWALGWTVTTAAGVSVEEQFVVFGISGALVAAGLQSLVVAGVVVNSVLVDSVVPVSLGDAQGGRDVQPS